jgi:hypothetical protein
MEDQITPEQLRESFQGISNNKVNSLRLEREAPLTFEISRL